MFGGVAEDAKAVAGLAGVVLADPTKRMLDPGPPPYQERQGPDRLQASLLCFCLGSTRKAKH